MRPDYAFEDMQDPDTDLAFRVGTFKDDRLIALELGGFTRWLVAAPDLLDRHEVAEPQDLSDVPCLTFRGDRPGATWRLKNMGDDVAVDVTGPIAVRSFGILLQLAVAGQGFAFLPDFMLADKLAAQELIRCLPGYTSPRNPVYLTFRPGARNIARIAAVISATEEWVPPLLASASQDKPF